MLITNKPKHATHEPVAETKQDPPETSIYQVIQEHPATWILSLTLVLAFFAFILSRFKVTGWKGYLPVLTSRTELKYSDEISNLKKKNEELEEKLKSYRPFDFFKKTENGEYIGYSVAKHPYVEFWADGNWSSQEYHIELATFGKLWGEEGEIIIYGKNPNIPSDFYAIVESKAKELPSLTIYCEYQVSKALSKYFLDFENVKIVVRS